MNKTYLEKRIEKKAHDRFMKEYIDATDIIARNPILKVLKIEVDGKMIPLHQFGTNRGLLNGNQYNEYRKNSLSEKTNTDFIKEELVKKYIEEETDSILNELSNIKFLLESGGEWRWK